VRALAGRIPRAFKSHKTPEGWAYGRYLRAKLQRLPNLPPDARPLLREAGRITIDLMKLGQRRDEIQSTKQPRQAALRRLGSESRKLRVQLLLIEKRLEEMAASNGHASSPTPADLLATLREDDDAAE